MCSMLSLNTTDSTCDISLVLETMHYLSTNCRIGSLFITQEIKKISIEIKRM